MGPWESCFWVGQSFRKVHSLAELAQGVRVGNLQYKHPQLVGSSEPQFTEGETSS